METVIRPYQFSKMTPEDQAEIKQKIIQYLKSLIENGRNIDKIEIIASRALNISKKIIGDVTSSKEFKNYLAYRKMTPSMRQYGSYIKRY